MEQKQNMTRRVDTRRHEDGYSRVGRVLQFGKMVQIDSSSSKSQPISEPIISKVYTFPKSFQKQSHKKFTGNPIYVKTQGVEEVRRMKEKLNVWDFVGPFPSPCGGDGAGPGNPQ